MVSGTKSIVILYGGAVAIFVAAIMYTSLSTQQLISKTVALGNNTAVSTPSAQGSVAPSYSPEPTEPTGQLTSSLPTGNVTTNWAGYEATNGTYTSVSGSWTVPQASASEDTAADATWVGIGGVTTNDLIQVGTQNVVSPSGQVTATAFYELLPDNSQDIPNVTVNDGDKITASVTEVGTSQWTISFKDITSGQSYASTVAYNSSESSAEWIEEEPSDGAAEIPLDDFGTVSFTGGSATENGASVDLQESGAQALTLVSGDDQALATTSSVGSDGASFTVTRTSAAAGTGIPQFNSNPGSWVRLGSGIGSVGNWRTYTMPSGSNTTTGTSYSFSTPSGTAVVVNWH